MKGDAGGQLWIGVCSMAVIISFCSSCPFSHFNFHSKHAIGLEGVTRYHACSIPIKTLFPYPNFRIAMRKCLVFNSMNMTCTPLEMAMFSLFCIFLGEHELGSFWAQPCYGHALLQLLHYAPFCFDLPRSTPSTMN